MSRFDHVADLAAVEGLRNLPLVYYQSAENEQGGGGSSSGPTGTGMRMARGPPRSPTRTDMSISFIAPSADRNVSNNDRPPRSTRRGRVLRRDTTPGAVRPRRSRWSGFLRRVSLFKRTQSRLCLYPAYWFVSQSEVLPSVNSQSLFLN